MGYTTDFYGQFSVSPVLTDEDREYLTKFSETRRMRRNIEGFGTEGEWYVGGEGFRGQTCDPTVIDYNMPPITQPGLWCHWIPAPGGAAIEWDGGEKFYYYTEWIEYLIAGYLAPRGYTLNGTVEWEGEDSSDRGRIVVTDNAVKVQMARLVYDE